MIFYLLLTIGAYLSATLQISLIHFNLLLVLVMILSSRLNFLQVIYFAFVSGLFIDAGTAGIMGQSSLGFIIILSIMPLVAYRFSFHNPVSRVFMYFVMSLLFELYSGHGFLVWQNLLVSLLVFVFSKSEKETIKL